MGNNENLTYSRREFIGGTVSGLALTAFTSSIMNISTTGNKFKAVAFDAFVIFDPRPVFATVNQLFPGKGKEVVEIWRTKQFEYSWLRTAGAKYKNFWQVTEDALSFATKKTDVHLQPGDRTMLMSKFTSLNIWPDVLPALQKLKQNGVKLAFLSNMTVDMLKTSARHAKIETYFDYFISTDEAQTYKPAPAAYQLGLQRLKLTTEEVLFAAFAGWDAAGSKWFGYPTFWVNRQKAPSEELGVTVDAAGPDLDELLKYLKYKH